MEMSFKKAVQLQAGIAINLPSVFKCSWALRQGELDTIHQFIDTTLQRRVCRVLSYFFHGDSSRCGHVGVASLNNI
jgi:hypothetical protein